MKTITALLILVAGLFLATSCKKDSSTTEPTPSTTKATLKILLTDAPSAYDAVNIDILSVGIHVDSGWYDFNLNPPGIYNLISLSNGTTALLIPAASVPAGTINQMRLHLGDSNTVVVDGVSHDLKTPSGQTSGYKVNIHETIQPGGSYQVLLDFDAEKSVVRQGNGGYLLKPVVNGHLMTAIGKIDGFAIPAGSASLATAFNATDTMNVYPDTLNGYFLINSLVPGTYNVKLTGFAPFHDTTLLNIPVTAGNITHLDTIHMQQ